MPRANELRSTHRGLTRQPITYLLLTASLPWARSAVAARGTSTAGLFRNRLPRFFGVAFIAPDFSFVTRIGTRCRRRGWRGSAAVLDAFVAVPDGSVRARRRAFGRRTALAGVTTGKFPSGRTGVAANFPDMFRFRSRFAGAMHVSDVLGIERGVRLHFDRDDPRFTDMEMDRDPDRSVAAILLFADDPVTATFFDDVPVADFPAGDPGGVEETFFSVVKEPVACMEPPIHLGGIGAVGARGAGFLFVDVDTDMLLLFVLVLPLLDLFDRVVLGAFSAAMRFFDRDCFRRESRRHVFAFTRDAGF